MDEAEGHLPLRRVAWQAVRLVVRADPRNAAVALVLAVAGAALPALGVLLTKSFVEEIATGEQANRAMVYAVGLAAVYGLSKAADIARVNHATVLSATTAHAANLDFLEMAGRIDAAYLDDPSFFDRMSRASQEVLQRPDQLTYSMINIVASGTSFLAVAAALVSIDPLVTLLVVASIIPGLIAQRRANIRQYEFRSGSTPRLRLISYLSGLLTDPSTGTELRAQASAQPIISRYRTTSQAHVAEQRRVFARIGSIHAVAGIVSALLLAGAFASVVQSARDGNLSAGDAAALVASISTMTLNFTLLANALSGVESHARFLRDYFEFLETPAVVVRHEGPTGGSDGGPGGGLCLRDVTFSYPGKRSNALEAVSFRATPGTLTAIVGPNGAGKTTLIRLLLRLYDPQSGSIELDGRPYLSFEPDELRRRFGVLFQEFGRYNFSVRELITITGREPSGDDALWASLRAADAERLVRGLPGELDAQVGRLFQGGRELSGGEWQKLALARLFYRDAAVWILDEPTSALDPEAEYAVFEQLRAQLGRRIGFVISHRFSSARSADQILVLDAGRLIEIGDHSELVAQRGRYFEMFERQAAGYR
ncbi:MAG: ABC transporter ATP-binding protein [Actinomycetota bacterium]